jgi:nucleoside 2-deoxyribosyltransferase
MRVYVAGPLFTDAERHFNAELAKRLRSAGHEIFLPQDAVGQDESQSPGYPARIFEADLRGLHWANAVVAVCDGPLVDDGTAWEIGYACARQVPVIGLRTDIRIIGPEERVNLMIQQSVRWLVTTVDEVVDKLDKLRDCAAAS